MTTHPTWGQLEAEQLIDDTRGLGILTVVLLVVVTVVHVVTVDSDWVEPADIPVESQEQGGLGFLLSWLYVGSSGQVHTE